VSAGRITAAALAAELSVSPSTVMNDAMVCGIGDLRGPYTPAQADAIRATRRDRQSRLTQRALATWLGVSPATVIKHAERLGFGGGRGYPPEQAEAIRRSVAATTPRARRRGQG
jgi:DNA-binding MurR/RpiR family transcriptional regulator